MLNTKKLNLLNIVFVLATVLGCSRTHYRSANYAYVQPHQLEDGLLTDNLISVGLDTNKIIGLTKLILTNQFPNIHSLLILKDDKLVYENYFSGEDENWGLSLGYAKHDVNSLHDSRSISKSVVSACIDIAMLQHKIKSLDDPIFNYLQGYEKYKTPQKEKISIRHLLTMSSGIKWDETGPHGTSSNNETQMERSMDPVEYVLSQPIAVQPGAVWNYNSGGIQVLAEIIRNVSGQDIDKFAEQFLFNPLGIKKYKWTKTTIATLLKPGNIFKLIGNHRSFPAAASGLRLTSRDLIKFGALYLNNGSSNGKQLLSVKYAEEALKTQILRAKDTKTNGYGYLFWTQTDTLNNKTFQLAAAKGNGGQRIFIDKDLRLIVVITAGNYENNHLKNNGEKALDDYILSSF
jgi:CubicO group peptidase (beta-lactamase class C family)